MPQIVDRAGLESLLAAGAHLVEVLAEREFAEEHLPGAVNVPLARLTPGSVAALRDGRPVVVYCWDAL